MRFRLNSLTRAALVPAIAAGLSLPVMAGSSADAEHQPTPNASSSTSGSTTGGAMGSGTSGSSSYGTSGSGTSSKDSSTSTGTSGTGTSGTTGSGTSGSSSTSGSTGTGSTSGSTMGSGTSASGDALFRQLDKDNNGSLDRSELSGNQGVQKQWADLDTNKDGRVTREEFTTNYKAGKQ